MRTTRLLATAATLSLAGGVALATASAAAASPARPPGNVDCVYQIASPDVHVWEFPGGSLVRNNREQSTRQYDKFNSTPSTISHWLDGKRWVQGTDVRNGHWGWVGLPYLFNAHCKLSGH